MSSPFERLKCRRSGKIEQEKNAFFFFFLTELMNSSNIKLKMFQLLIVGKMGCKGQKKIKISS